MSAATTMMNSNGAGGSNGGSAADASALFIPFPSLTPVPSAAAHITSSSAAHTSKQPSSFEFHSQLDLSSIRDTLIRLEESIIFALIERAQFKRNDEIYKMIGGEKKDGGGQQQQQQQSESLLSRFLHSTECLHASVRRYTSPCEHSYSPSSTLPTPLLPQLSYPPTIKSNTINHNTRIMKFYLSTVLPSICQEGDDSNYGSSCVCDVTALQLLSKRIHYGKFVAESKFLSDRASFTSAIKARDIAALTGLITKPSVEEQVLKRVGNKAEAYGKSPTIAVADADSNTSASAAASSAATSATTAADKQKPKISPEVIKELYEIIMTMTKDVQIEYLLQRLEE